MTGETMKQLVGCPWNSSTWNVHVWGDFTHLVALPSDSLLLLFLINVSRRSSGVYDSCRSCRTLPQIHFLAECFIVLHAKLLQSCPTLCSPMDFSPPGYSVHRILKASILEWVTMPSSRGSS